MFDFANELKCNTVDMLGCHLSQVHTVADGIVRAARRARETEGPGSDSGSDDSEDDIVKRLVKGKSTEKRSATSQFGSDDDDGEEEDGGEKGRRKVDMRRRMGIQVGSGQSWGVRTGNAAWDNEDSESEDEGTGDGNSVALLALTQSRETATHNGDHESGVTGISNEASMCGVCVKCGGQRQALPDPLSAHSPEPDNCNAAVNAQGGGAQIAAVQREWTAGEMMMSPDRLIEALQRVSESNDASAERSTVINHAIVAGGTLDPKVR